MHQQPLQTSRPGSIVLGIPRSYPLCSKYTPCAWRHGFCLDSGGVAGIRPVTDRLPSRRVGNHAVVPGSDFCLLAGRLSSTHMWATWQKPPKTCIEHNLVNAALYTYHQYPHPPHPHIPKCPHIPSPWTRDCLAASSPISGMCCPIPRTVSLRRYVTLTID